MRATAPRRDARDDAWRLGPTPGRGNRAAPSGVPAGVSRDSVRHALVKIRTNKVFLDYDANRFISAHVFPDLLMKDFRYETRYYDEAYVLQRVMKIRELYRILDVRRPVPAGRPSRERKPQVCIIELASLLGNLGRHVTPDRKFTYTTIDASTILTSIANKIREKVNEPPP